jgi:hypothetical protein
MGVFVAVLVAVGEMGVFVAVLVAVGETGVLVAVFVAVLALVAVGVLVGAVTMMVPVIKGWTAQWYAYVPALVNVKENVCPGFRNPEFHTPVSEVEECCTVPLLVQRTVSPTGMLTGSGVKENSWIDTSFVARKVLGAAALTWSMGISPRYDTVRTAAIKPTMIKYRDDMLTPCNGWCGRC